MKKFSVATLLLLTGCAVFESPSAQIQGTWDGPPAIKVQRHEWRQVSAAEVQRVCAFAEEIEGSCTYRVHDYADGLGPICLIFSTMSEAEAHHRYEVTITGTRLRTHWQHEVEEHCHKGLNHRVKS
jgi:hypothetical protein